jgi:hypothetical protein
VARVTHVWIAQCLCPSRHCILAAADAFDDDPVGVAAALETRETLKSAIGKLLTLGWLNPWCGLCHAGKETWTYEVGRTPYATMAEAAPALALSQAAQTSVSAQFGDMDRSRPN